MCELYPILKYTFLRWKYLGLISFKVKIRPEGTYMEKSRLHFVITTIFQVAISLLSVPNYYFGILNHFEHWMSPLQFGAILLYHLSNLSFITLVIMLWKFDNSMTISLLNRLAAIVRELADIDVNIDIKQLKVSLRITMIATVTVCLFFSLIFIRDIGNYSVQDRIFALAYIYTSISGQSFFEQYLVFILIVKYILCQLNQGLPAVVNIFNVDEKNYDIKTIKRILKLTEEIFLCVDSINQLFSLLLLVEFLSFTSYAITQIFRALKAWSFVQSEIIDTFSVIQYLMIFSSTSIVALISIGIIITVTQSYLSEVRHLTNITE